MNFIRFKDHIRIDKKGVATITKRNIELLNIKSGDHFCLSLDLDSHSAFLNRIYFLKLQVNTRCIDLSKVIELKKSGSKTFFYINPVLKVLKIEPLFIAELDPESGNGYDFSIILPEDRKIILDSEIRSMLRKL
jgi:hypothetical protein